MKEAVRLKYGQPDILEIKEVEKPSPGRACCIGFLVHFN
jgi:hypothetical protein